MRTFNCCFTHSACMMRADAIAKVGLYAEDFPTCEDYELFRRLATRFDLVNLPDCLVEYRVCRGSLSAKRRQRLLLDRLRVQWRYFDPRAWRAWAGIAKSLFLFAVPLQMIIAVKRFGMRLSIDTAL